eukprot:TRINITY_DN3894_c0_g3_i1.p1 TRINITY_DN3894_c0_g3~~TRINITY_DN3894_c0_g3_i1.p1  ORF type:complete len:126 (+),score=14.08 TRINITY_DN3894_c0_g3_i1:163-540(+)
MVYICWQCESKSMETNILIKWTRGRCNVVRISCCHLPLPPSQGLTATRMTTLPALLTHVSEPVEYEAGIFAFLGVNRTLNTVTCPGDSVNDAGNTTMLKPAGAETRAVNVSRADATDVTERTATA